MTAVAPIVRARGLGKRFGKSQVLSGLDFEIPPGRIYGLVGHNGAGKTTTLNALLGLTDHEGALEVLGLDPFRARATLMRDVAFVSDVATLPRYLNVRELFDLISSLHPRFAKEKATRFLEGTGLRPELAIKKLSKGMIAQLHLAVALAIDAKLLVLDEPTLGLDIVSRKRFYKQLLEDYMTETRTVILSTHQVDEVESLLTDVIFLREGRIVLDASIEDIASRYAQVRVRSADVQNASSQRPLHTETRMGQAIMVFEDVPEEALAPFGEIGVPSLSDLYVALMQRGAR